ncbi:hypothetical protein BD769DRAFT_1385330 [Suillus cothurnatus]|nr:hypothetical protein BD769DRAFT_1385330 [Suillus cothurnatus]
MSVTGMVENREGRQVLMMVSGPVILDLQDSVQQEVAIVVSDIMQTFCLTVVMPFSDLSAMIEVVVADSCLIQASMEKGSENLKETKESKRSMLTVKFYLVTIVNLWVSVRLGVAAKLTLEG